MLKIIFEPTGGSCAMTIFLICTLHQILY